MASEPSLFPKASPGDQMPGAPPVDPAQESLVRALRASFNILRVLMIVLVILYVLSGIFQVGPGQQGLVARLGKLRLNPTPQGDTPIFAPGWYWALPDPFDKKYTLTGLVQKWNVTHFMFANPQAATSTNLAEIVLQSQELQPGVDGAMFTGDKNLSHGRFEVQYKIRDAARFVQNIGETPQDFEPLLERLTETAVVREVASRTVEEVTRTALEAVRAGVQRRLQAALDRLDTGVEVARILPYTIEPGMVRPAFIEVSMAESKKLTLEQEAEQNATETLNRAGGEEYPTLLTMIRAYGEAQLRGAPDSELSGLQGKVDAQLVEAERKGAGQVAVKLRDARAQANEVNERLRTEYEEFTKYLEQRKARPAITLLGLWTQMREQVFSHRENEVFFVPQSDVLEIIVNRDQERLRQLQEERDLKRQRGER